MTCLPRSLDVEKLVAARAPEIEAFTILLKQKSKDKASAIANAKAKSSKKRKTNDDNDSLVAEACANDLSVHRSQRRRTTSYLRRSTVARHRKRHSCKRKRSFQQNREEEADNGEKKLSRRVRRRIELKGNPNGGFGCSGDGTKRLLTHVWHAKRFRMVKKWGYYLPLGLFGKGKGSRSLLRRSEEGVLLHDASYYSAVQLEGPEASILKIMRKMLQPSPPSVDSMSEMQKAEILGTRFGTAMLKKPEELDYGVIAPVRYIWCPYFMNKQTKLPGFEESVQNEEQAEDGQKRRYLWFWIHAAAFDDALTSLQSACEKQTKEEGVHLACFSRKGEIAMLDIIGSKASQLLQKVFHPISGYNDDAERLNSEACTDKTVFSYFEISRLSEAYLLANCDKLPNASVLFMEVSDPRDLPSKCTGPISCTSYPREVNDAEHTSLESTKCYEDSLNLSSRVQMSDENRNTSRVQMSDENGNTEKTILDRGTDILMSFQSDNHAGDMPRKDRRSLLWAVQNDHSLIEPPPSESVLCEKRHKQRLDFFRFARFSGENTISANPKTEQARPGISCPIVALKTLNRKSSASGWSIILPLNWVKVFWIPFVLRGAQAVGLEERRWLMNDAGLPSFPFDFPDCEAYNVDVHEKPIAYENRGRTPSKIPELNSIPLPWNKIQRFNETGLKSDDTMHLKKDTDGNLSSDNFCLASPMESVQKRSSNLEEKKISDNGSPCLHQSMDCVFPAIVARTPHSLKQYLNEIGGLHLLLFPECSLTRKKTCFQLMEERRIGWREKTMHYFASPNLCFLRVLLHAPGKGSIAGGASVCAPLETDFVSWCSRPQDWKGLEIAPSLKDSELNQEWTSDRRIMHLNDTSYVSGEANLRMPIGFVTTGVCHGSSSAIATAICEATILGKLRAEQWREKRWMKRLEIFVLFRNANSTAYHPALASIVLEDNHDFFCW